MFILMKDLKKGRSLSMTNYYKIEQALLYYVPTKKLTEQMKHDLNLSVSHY